MNQRDSSAVGGQDDVADVDFDLLDDDLIPASSYSARRGRHSLRFLYALMAVSAILCITASAVLSIEAYHLALDPNAVLACDINSALSCGTVAQSWQAQFFGFPNAFIGLATEPVVLTIAVLGLCGTKFPRWFLFCAQIGYTLGLIFAYWLFYQSFFNIGALCPWCLLITVFTTVTFFTMLHINIAERTFYVSAKTQARLDRFVEWHLDVIIPALLLATILIMIMVKYGIQIINS